ncbi:arylamine N-acetyltransferase 1 [Mycena alexandri]|uniref:Arylamine N-acetyltransferase 1 n=1 Tax=Mycena alexandri TaxID=1745969 RepID=A0AAD6X4T6_9AGAR|nr:arylamine N-acetyltransferase 1 [Mycena alexandri]
MAREPTFATDALNNEQIAAYLARIQLPASLAQSVPSLELLSEDTTVMHVPREAWSGPSQPIVLRSALTAAFERIVTQHAGGYCWANNPTFAALLRGLGFRVSECATKVFKNWANLDPTDTVVKDKWGTITHVVLVVDWTGSGERYVLDVGFGGGGCPIPMPLREGATVAGLNPFEAWTMRHEPLPHDPADTPPIDIIPGWTMYRRTSSSPSGFASHPAPPTLDEPSTWAHQYHFPPCLDHNTRHRLDGVRRARARGDTGGARDIEYVAMETGPMRVFLEKEFGFVFDP